MSPQENRVSAFARTNFRGDHRLFGIKRADRRYHMYLIGKTGTGKSTVFETLLRQDIEAGEGCAVVDPHGDLVEHLRASVPENRLGDLIVFDPGDPEGHVGFNPLAGVPPAKRSLAVAGLVEVFKKTWLDSWGPRVEHLLRNALFALLEQPEATLADVSRLLHDPAYRERVVERVTNVAVRNFWKNEYEGYSKSLRALVVAPLENKLGAYLTDPRLRNVLTVPRGVDLRRIMDERKILLVNLSKGKLGEGPAMLLGSLLVAQISLLGLARAEEPEEKRADFFLYLDEFQTFATENLTAMLSELRKYRVSLILANQYLAQLDSEIREAVLGNVGTLVTFRVGPTDAQILTREFSPEFTASDLTSLPNHEIYLRLMVDGMVTRPFSGETVKLG